MNSIKVNLSVVLPGSTMLSKEECLKTIQKTVEKKNKKGKTYKKTVDTVVDDIDKMDINTLKVVDKDGKNPEYIHFYTRRSKPASQSLNINEDAYKYMISSDCCPEWCKIGKWNSMSKKERLESHLKRITEHLGGISYSYQVFND